MPYIEAADAVGSETILRVYYLDEGNVRRRGRRSLCCAAGFVPRLNRTEGGASLAGARQDGVARAVWQRHCFLNVCTVSARGSSICAVSQKCCQAVTTQRSFKSALGFMRDTT